MAILLIIITSSCFLKALVSGLRSLKGPFLPRILLLRIKIIDKEQVTAPDATAEIEDVCCCSLHVCNCISSRGMQTIASMIHIAKTSVSCRKLQVTQSMCQEVFQLWHVVIKRTIANHFIQHRKFCTVQCHSKDTTNKHSMKKKLPIHLP